MSNPVVNWAGQPQKMNGCGFLYNNNDNIELNNLNCTVYFRLDSNSTTQNSTTPTLTESEARLTISYKGLGTNVLRGSGCAREVSLRELDRNFSTNPFRSLLTSEFQQLLRFKRFYFLYTCFINRLSFIFLKYTNLFGFSFNLYFLAIDHTNK